MNAAGSALVMIGVALMALAAVGAVRLPDVLLRMNAATKAGSLGIALILAGTALLLPGLGSAVKLTLAVVLQFVTAPVAAQVIGRAAYRSGAPLWSGTERDELASRVRR